MKIAVMGCGYVGLVSAACFAEFGYEVVCYDNNVDKINNLCRGIIPIHEPGLESLVNQGVGQGRLSFVDNIGVASQDAKVILIAVGTPTCEDNGAADLTCVYQVAKEIAHNLTPYTVVVTKSTVPVGTCQEIASIISQCRSDLVQGVDFDVASNPEFLREGSAISDFLRPDRVVVGTSSDKAKAVLQELYRPLYLIETPIVFTSIASAELAKYASNGFLAVKIGFINQIADLCEKTQADVQDVAKIMGLDGRIGRKFLHAGPGYGGSCFPKDTKALADSGKKHGTPLSIIDAVITSNDDRKYAMAKRIEDIIVNKASTHKTPFSDVNSTPNTNQNPTVAILGITFKPNTDDLRDSPSLVIIPYLLAKGIRVQIYDPLYNKNTASRILAQHFYLHEWSQVVWAKTSYDAMDGVDGVAILTEWNEFRALDLTRMAKLMRYPNLIDLRNIYKPKEMVGLNYYSVGRPSIFKAIEPHSTVPL